ncbi:MAG: hypothetical protein KGL39_29970 [Patescibacteria group bacterium]|nr:hypothetical protein [Patescibacteria group bacterium]
MKTTLPRFEGTLPSGAVLKLSGGTEDRVGALALGEEVYIVCKGTVTGITHQNVKDVFTRLHTVQPSALVLLERSDGERMLTEGQLLADERFGVDNLFKGDGEGEGKD